jgi:anti-sigma B factor antagonist
MQTGSWLRCGSTGVDSRNGRAIIAAMKILATQLGDAQVLALMGRLDSEAAPEFEQRCLREVRGETQTLILDMSGLEYLSSAGLRTILSAGKALQAKDGKLVLCAPPGQTRQIVEAAGFHKLFPVCASVQEASKHTSGTFRLHSHKEWEVDVITIFGRIDAERAPEMEAAGRRILDTPYRKLLINMSAVQYLSSAGLCALLNLGKLAQSKNGRLFLCSPSAAVRQILKLSGFDKILAIKDSVQDALVE